MDKDVLFTFKQRAQELIKALKRHRTAERQQELDEIKESLAKAETSSE